MLKSLKKKGHNFELERDKAVNVRIYYKVSGIDSGSCVPELLDKYRMNDKTINFKFSILKNEMH